MRIPPPQILFLLVSQFHVEQAPLDNSCIPFNWMISQTPVLRIDKQNRRIPTVVAPHRDFLHAGKSTRREESGSFGRENPINLSTRCSPKIHLSPFRSRVTLTFGFSQNICNSNIFRSQDIIKKWILQT